MDISTLTSYVPALSADWIIVGALVLFFTFDALRAGPSRLTALALALPIALLLSESMMTTAYIGTLVAQSAPALQTGAFIVLALGLFIALYRIVDSGRDSSNALLALLAGVGATAIVIVVLLQLPAATVPWTFSDSFNTIFGEAYRLFWFIAAYFAIAIARG